MEGINSKTSQIHTGPGAQEVALDQKEIKQQSKRKRQKHSTVMCKEHSLVHWVTGLPVLGKSLTSADLSSSSVMEED